MNIGIDPKKYGPGTKVAIYCRVSSKGQAKAGQGLDVQKKACKEIADKYGWIVYKIYFNPNGISGTIAPDKRPEFMEMIKDGSMRKFKIVLAFSLDRLGRTAGKTETAKELIYDTGLELCIEGQLLPNSITGRFYTGIHSNMVALDRALMLERLDKGMEEAKRTRGESRGKLPFGYLKIGEGKKSRIEIDAYRAKVVRLIYELRYKENKSLEYIAKYLNENDFKPPRSDKWSHNKVAEFLKGRRLRIYRGCLRNDENEQGVRWPAILDSEYDQYIEDEPEENIKEEEKTIEKQEEKEKISNFQPLLPTITKKETSDIVPIFDTISPIAPIAKVKTREKISEFISL